MSDDEELLAELAGVFARADPVPELAVRTAKASFSLRSLDVDLALLTWDSDVHEPAVGLRAVAGEEATSPRALCFEHAEVVVEVEITPRARGWALRGQLEPPEGAEPPPAGDRTAGSTPWDHILLQRLPGPADPDAPAGGAAGEHPVEDRRIPVDELGRFAADDLDAGLIRLLVPRAGRPPVTGAWVRVP